MQKILVYSPKISGRVRYIFDFVLTEFSGLDFELSTDLENTDNPDYAVIHYDTEEKGKGFFLKADDFMFENGFSDKISFEELNPVGKCFYALSRYDEYLPQQRDKHDRLSGVGRVYKTPFVDQWIIDFQKDLKKLFPQLEFKKRNFEIILTSDVDQAWKYKHKGGFRTAGGLLNDLMKFNFVEFSKRFAVNTGKENDPFDRFDYFKNLKEKYNFRMIFFWLMADYAEFDKNNPVSNHKFQQLIREVSEWADFGIHPSYASSEDKNKIKTEIGRLSAILNKPVSRSRQHFIKLKLPDTYRNLIENHLTEDYTMAYADQTGFRAGTATPFYWFDFEKEEKTDLRIHPFCAMDVTLKNYMKLTIPQSIDEINRLKTEIKKVDGQMILLFHNSNFTAEWEGWEKVLESVF